ncbi:universal stress protein [Ramlibacter sp. PS4R-6]|uniref:universal stress protein n=1 Tax=Ramlibacter sp. PS4R-6 TaxID=3133438 RepID=UPI0030B695BE
MKMILAADGSPFTKKALAFLVNQEGLCAGCELLVINVQPPVPPRVKTLAGAGVVAAWHRDEAHKVLDPIARFLDRHEIAYKTQWVVGHASDEIVAAAQKAKAQMIVMGTHGYGAIGRAFMGSVAQKVVTQSKVPVLLVK